MSKGVSKGVNKGVSEGVSNVSAACDVRECVRVCGKGGRSIGVVVPFGCMEPQRE